MSDQPVAETSTSQHTVQDRQPGHRRVSNLQSKQPRCRRPMPLGSEGRTIIWTKYKPCTLEKQSSFSNAVSKPFLNIQVNIIVR